MSLSSNPDLWKLWLNCGENFEALGYFFGVTVCPHSPPPPTPTQPYPTLPTLTHNPKGEDLASAFLYTKTKDIRCGRGSFLYFSVWGLVGVCRNPPIGLVCTVYTQELAPHSHVHNKTLFSFSKWCTRWDIYWVLSLPTRPRFWSKIYPAKTAKPASPQLVHHVLWILLWGYPSVPTSCN